MTTTDDQNTGLLCVHERGSRCCWYAGQLSVPAVGTRCTAPTGGYGWSKVW